MENLQNVRATPPMRATPTHVENNGWIQIQWVCSCKQCCYRLVLFMSNRFLGGTRTAIVWSPIQSVYKKRKHFCYSW